MLSDELIQKLIRLFHTTINNEKIDELVYNYYNSITDNGAFRVQVLSLPSRLMIENSLNGIYAISDVRNSRIIARGRLYIIEINFSRIIDSAVAYIWTFPSGRFRTVPETCKSVAILRTHALNPTR